MPKFSKHVALMSPEYQAANFGPGDEVPEWALDQVGAHVLEPEETADPDESDAPDDSASQGQEQGNDSGADDEPDDDGDGEDPNPPASDDQPDFTAPAPARRGRTRKQ